MKTISVDLYGFEELAPVVQAKVIEDNRYINEDGDWFADVIDVQQVKLDSLGFKDAEILFSGFYSQGDGASFTCKTIDLDQYLVGEFEPLKGLEISGSVYRPSGRYVHENSVTVELVNETDGTMTVDQEALLLKLENSLVPIVRQLNKDIYKQLEEEHEHLTSNETVAATLLANEYTFEQNGRMRNA